MDYRIILVGVAIIFVLLLIIKYMHKRLTYKIGFHQRRHEDIKKDYRELKRNLDEEIKKSKKAELSLKNIENALLYPFKNGYKRHTFIHELTDKQKIVIVFDEELEHSRELQQQLLDRNLDPLKLGRDVECFVFLDGEYQDPLLLRKVFKGETTSVIEDINCGKYTSRGVGTFVIQDLENVLKGMGITKISASLSSVDYQRKDKLYNFYIVKNNFRLVSELTEDTWGLVAKDL